MPDTKAFYQDVYSVVKEIPTGRVATYKQIAILTGFPQHARLVGRGFAVTYRSARPSLPRW